MANENNVESISLKENDKLVPQQNIKKQVKLYNENPEIIRPTQILDYFSNYVDEHNILPDATHDIYLSLLLQRLVGADPDFVDKSVKASDLRLQVGEYPVYSIKAQGWFVRDERWPKITDEMMSSFITRIMPEYIKEEMVRVEAKEKRTDGDYDFACVLNVNTNFSYNDAVKQLKINNNELSYLEENGKYFLTRAQYLIDPFSVEGKTLSRYRVNVTKAQWKFVIIIRKIDTEIPDFFDLKLNIRFLEFITKEKWLVLVTWPTGSGKSTTLAALINEINKNYKKHVVTMENPVEFLHTNNKSFFTQRDIPTDSRSFGSAMKSALRQAPDIILFWEMRDEETIRGALEAAETWHLVFWTLHTVNAAKTIDRILSTFPSNEQNQIANQLSTSFVGCISQALVKTKDWWITTLNEMLVWTPDVRQLIAKKDIPGIGSASKNAPKDHLSLVRHAFELIKEWRIEQNEAFEKIYNVSLDDYKDLVDMLKQANIYDEKNDKFTPEALAKKTRELIKKIQEANGIKEWKKKEEIESWLSESAKIEKKLNNEEENKTSWLLIDEDF